MNRSLKKRFVIMLTLFVSLLPFSFSYGLAAAVAKAHPMSHSHNMKTDCAKSGADTHCIDMTQASSTDGDCSSGHCDSSLAAQPGVAVEYGLQISTGQQLRTAGRVWTSGPIPPTLLRPPPARS